jgi:hypothetical protein
LPDLNSYPLKTDIQLWTSRSKTLKNGYLESLLPSWHITEGVSVAHTNGNFKHVLCGVTKANIYSFYNSFMGNLFIVNEFIQYLAPETENLFTKNSNSTFELSQVARK